MVNFLGNFIFLIFALLYLVVIVAVPILIVVFLYKLIKRL